LLIRCRENREIYQVHLYVLGIFIQWDDQQGLVTGRTAPADCQSEVRGIHRHETLLIEPDTAVDLDKLEIAKTVILSSNLPLETKDTCIQHFSIAKGSENES
jgi:hypothetical protein